MEIYLIVVLRGRLRDPLLENTSGEGAHQYDAHLLGLGFVHDALLVARVTGVLEEQIVLNLHDVEGTRLNETADRSGDALRREADIADRALPLRRLQASEDAAWPEDDLERIVVDPLTMVLQQVDPVGLQPVEALLDAAAHFG